MLVECSFALSTHGKGAMCAVDFLTNVQKGEKRWLKEESSSPKTSKVDDRECVPCLRPGTANSPAKAYRKWLHPTTFAGELAAY